MSTQSMIKISVNTTKENEEFLAGALRNAGIILAIEQKKNEQDSFNFSIPASIASVSIFLHAIESNPTAFTGQVTLPDGGTFTLDESGRTQLKTRLSEAMRQPQQSVQQAPVWWMYFIPQIGEIITEIAGLVKWYPRAVGESQKKVTIAFMLVIAGIISVVGGLTYVDKVSGDAFIFVIGILLGYIFAFLSKFLGLAGSNGG